MENINTLVVGGGFGGIAAALRCKAMGHNVTIIDKLSKLGGRAQVIERNGYKYDTGPTVITAPFLIEELFNLFNEKLSDHLEFKPLDPWYRFHFHDSTTFDYSSTVEKTKKEISKFSPEDAESYDNAIQITISIANIDPLNFDIKAQEASLEQANGWLEEKFPSGEYKHIIIDERYAYVI